MSKKKWWGVFVYTVPTPSIQDEVLKGYSENNA